MKKQVFTLSKINFLKICQIPISKGIRTVTDHIIIALKIPRLEYTG